MPVESRSQHLKSACWRRHPIRALPRHAAGALLSLLAALGALAGCTTLDRPVRLYSLMAPVDAALDAAGPRASKPMRAMPIVLSPIRLPAQVDQPQILVRLDDGSLLALEQQRWASPLRAEIREAMLERLTVRYGAVETRTNTDLKTPPTDLQVVFRRFDSKPGLEALIEGSWTVTRSSDVVGENARRTLTCDWTITEPAPGGVPSLAKAHRRALNRLTDQIGRALADPSLGSCPAIDPAVDDAPNAAA